MSEAEAAARLIARSRRIVGFTGAGVSTESGVPDFRSPGGLWSKYDPSDATFDRFLQHQDVRERYWQRHSEMYEILKEARPNPAHGIFAWLHEAGKLIGVITQNIDGLHAKAGVPETKVAELHGTALAVTCVQCGREEDREAVHRRVKEGERAPACPCGGPLKPATISFGQALDPTVLALADQWTQQVELMLCMGSSLLVQPAASFPYLAKNRGARVVLVNREPTPFDPHADLVVRAACGAFMAEVMEQLGAAAP